MAEIAAAAATHYGLPEADVTLVRRAGLLHDIGKVGICAGLWGKGGTLTDREWEQVRLHPYYTERVLAAPYSWPRLARSLPCIINGWMAPAIIAASPPSCSRQLHASSPPPTATAP